MLSREARSIKFLESFEWSKVRCGSQVEADVIEEQHALSISADLPMEHADWRHSGTLELTRDLPLKR